MFVLLEPTKNILVRFTKRWCLGLKHAPSLALLDYCYRLSLVKVFFMFNK